MAPFEQLIQTPLFHGIPIATLAQLLDSATEMDLHPGETIVRQHDEARYVFILLSGSIRFLIRFEGVDDLFVGRTQNFGELIGWSAFRLPYRYTATVEAEGPSHLLRLERAKLMEKLNEDPELGFKLLSRVATSLANRLEQTRDLLVTTRQTESYGDSAAT